ncbi:MAG: hypothetical protein ABSE06_01185 [Anaerolineaceae bacterium]|jgi:hypothetical protein
MSLYFGNKQIHNQEELEESLANLEEPVLIRTLNRDEIVRGMTDLVEALSESSLPNSLANVNLPAGLLVWDFISAAGLTDFAEEIMGPDLYGKIQDQIGSGSDEA